MTKSQSSLLVLVSLKEVTGVCPIDHQHALFRHEQSFSQFMCSMLPFGRALAAPLLLEAYFLEGEYSLRILCLPKS
jgi:hypothetical protein